MKKVISKNKIPIKIWTDDIDSGAIDQASNLANLPFAFKHIAIMPDVHQGYGMPIGGVMATKEVVVPNAVGVDIGCGMCAVKTSLTKIDKDTLKKIMGEIRKAIPVGFKKHKEYQDTNLMPDGLPYCDIVNKEIENAMRSLGTLGGGNHFIEIQKGSDGHIWIMLHSGSRNLGFKIAHHYNELAIKLNEKWHSGIPRSWGLAYLPTDSEEGQAYIREMNYAVAFALANRKLMMNRIMDIFINVLNGCGFLSATSDENNLFLNIAHNYAQVENHFGKDVWVHRKGATLARKGTTGIIPGSMGTKSYIVEGLGNPDSFNSCSHGAGRRMSRTKAKKELSLEKEIKLLDDQGIIHGLRGEGNLDEASSAYKDIQEIMENQKDLITIKTELQPIAVIKG